MWCVCGFNNNVDNDFGNNFGVILIKTLVISLGMIWLILLCDDFGIDFDIDLDNMFGNKFGNDFGNNFGNMLLWWLW